jgi:hypothetical protein
MPFLVRAWITPDIAPLWPLPVSRPNASESTDDATVKPIGTNAAAAADTVGCGADGDTVVADVATIDAAIDADCETVSRA